MKKIFMALIVLALAGSVAYAAEAAKATATEPVGGVIELGGVIVARVVSVVTEASGKGSVTVTDEAGKTKVFSVNDTVKVVDNMFNALTLNQLKKDDKVSVEYTKEGSAEKAKTITVVK